MNNNANPRAKGNKGEDLACKFLQNKGFLIVERNFYRKWGELDIIAEKDRMIHFFEVKSVFVTNADNYQDSHRPEDNVDGWKIKHLRRIVETYLDYSRRGLDSEFQFHVICVYMNHETRRAKIKWINNVIM